MKKMICSALLGGLGILFGGCSTPVKSPSELSSTPDPAPQAEPPSRTGNPPSYEVFGKRYYVMNTSSGYRERGLASWYGKDFHGKKTSSGTPYDMYAISAAHKSLPIPAYVRVTHLENGRSIVVRVDDRGPFVDGRIIDLSYAAAAKLGIVEQGTAPVEVVALPPYQYLPGHGPNTPALAQNTPIPATDFRIAPKPGFTPIASQVTAGHDSQTMRSSRVSQARTNTVDRVFTNAQPMHGQPLISCYVQIGAFAERRNAEILQSRLSGRLGRVVRIDSGNDNLHRVRIGPLRDVSEAEMLSMELATLGIDKPRIVFN